MPKPKLTMTELNSAVSAELVKGGYTEIVVKSVVDELSALDKLFEDDYGVVGSVVYETWKELDEQWPSAQDELVSIMSRFVSKTHRKAWDGYLVLLTPGEAGREGLISVADIRYDTNSVRKLLSTGESLTSLLAVRKALLPLLPLEQELRDVHGHSLLGDLPGLFETQGRDPEPIRCVVEASLAQQDLFEALRRLVEGRQ